METQEDELWDDIMQAVLSKRINNGGYGIGYIKEFVESQKPAVTNLLMLENPEKLTKIRRPNIILFYIEPDDSKPETLLNYAWRVEDVLGQKGVLKIEREIEHYNNITNTKKVLFRWNGDDGGSEWVDVDRLKDPQFVLDYIESCLNGKYSLPF